MLKLDIEGYTPAEVTRYMIEGLRRERTAIDARIEALENQPFEQVVIPAALPPKRKGYAPKLAPPREKRQLSADARRRIAEGQKKRWAKASEEQTNTAGE